MPLKVLTAALVVGLVACSREPAVVVPPGAATVGDEVISEAEVQREVLKLPAGLREQFESEAGRREFIRSMIDKRLLEREARRRGIAERPEIQRQVSDLETRLIVKALLADEERAAGTPGEDAARAYYTQHASEFGEPARVRVARVRVSVPVSAGERARLRARQKVEGLMQRLRKGEALEVIAALGDGPERVRGGELGQFGPGEFPNTALEQAGLALAEPGDVSDVIVEPDGFALLVLLERAPARTPAFEEVRRAIENRLLPSHQRKVFDRVLEKLRSEQTIEVHAGPEAPKR